MKRRIAFAVAGIVLAAAVWLFVATRSSDDGPVYAGKTAREWFSNYVISTNKVEAHVALMGMGSNVVPFLVHELEGRDTAVYRFYMRNYPRLPRVIRHHLSKPVSQDERCYSAAWLLMELDARAGTPGLLRLVSEAGAGEEWWVFSLLALLGNRVGPGDTNCIPQLKICLQSKNEFVRLSAINLLGQIKADAPTVPVLTNLLTSTNGSVRSQAFQYLRKVDPKLAAQYEISWQKQAAATNSQSELRGK